MTTEKNPKPNPKPGVSPRPCPQELGALASPDNPLHPALLGNGKNEISLLRPGR